MTTAHTRKDNLQKKCDFVCSKEMCACVQCVCVCVYHLPLQDETVFGAAGFARWDGCVGFTAQSCKTCRLRGVSL